VSDSYMRTPGSAWSQFAGIFLFIVGIFNVLDGVVALTQKSHFEQAGLVYHNLTAWGVAYLIIGIVQLLAGWLVLSHNAIGRVLGLIIVVISMAVSFLSFGAYPGWALLTIAMDAIVIWGLTARWEA